jgi:hypothetical protein
MLCVRSLVVQPTRATRVSPSQRARPVGPDGRRDLPERIGVRGQRRGRTGPPTNKGAEEDCSSSRGGLQATCLVFGCRESRTTRWTTPQTSTTHIFCRCGRPARVPLAYLCNSTRHSFSDRSCAQRANGAQRDSRSRGARTSSWALKGRPAAAAHWGPFRPRRIGPSWSVPRWV